MQTSSTFLRLNYLEVYMLKKQNPSSPETFIFGPWLERLTRCSPQAVRHRVRLQLPEAWGHPHSLPSAGGAHPPGLEGPLNRPVELSPFRCSGPPPPHVICRRSPNLCQSITKLSRKENHIHTHTHRQRTPSEAVSREVKWDVSAWQKADISKCLETLEDQMVKLGQCLSRMPSACCGCNNRSRRSLSPSCP